MKLGLVIISNDPETVWNAFRFGNHAVKVTEQMAQFAAAGGTIMACGTCLKLRQAGGSEMCPVSTMHDLHRLVAECDKVLTF